MNPGRLIRTNTTVLLRENMFQKARSISGIKTTLSMMLAPTLIQNPAGREYPSMGSAQLGQCSTHFSNACPQLLHSGMFIVSPFLLNGSTRLSHRQSIGVDVLNSRRQAPRGETHWFRPKAGRCSSGVLH